jgi:hypothetical protein
MEARPVWRHSHHGTRLAANLPSRGRLVLDAAFLRALATLVATARSAVAA